MKAFGASARNLDDSLLQRQLQQAQLRQEQQEMLEMHERAEARQIEELQAAMEEAVEKVVNGPG